MIVAKIRELVEDDRVACPGFRFSAFLKHRERFIATVQAIKKTVVLSAILEYNDIGYLDLEDPSNINKLNATVQTIIETLEDTEFYIEGCDENGIKL